MTFPVEPGEPEPYVITLIRQFRERLINGETQQLATMAAEWVTIEYRLQAYVESLVADIQVRVAAGEAIPIDRLVKLERYLRLNTQVQLELGAFMDNQAAIIANMQQQLAQAGLADANTVLSLLDSMTAGNVIGAWDILPVEAVANMVGLAGDGSPLRVLLDEAIATGSQQALAGLVEATALGYNPRRTARMFFEGLAGGLNRAMVIARTEQLRVYRDAARQQYQQSGVVVGYKRISARDTRVCPACLLADDGTVYPLDQPFDEHPQGRCAIVPVVERIPVNWQTGKDWLQQQPEATQQYILGKGRYNAWQEGLITLDDIPTRKFDETWGGAIVPKPLYELIGE